MLFHKNIKIPIKGKKSRNRNSVSHYQHSEIVKLKKLKYSHRTVSF